METEFEVKFYPVSKEKIRKRLKSLSAKLIFPERKLRRVIFDGKRANPQIKGDYLRVRDEVNCVTLSVKIHAREGGLLADQKELCVKVSDFEKTIQILEVAGLKRTNYQETLRETWDLEGAEITIDTWPGLEPFVEVEGKSEDEVRRIAEKLGFNWQDKIITSVLEIYMRVYNLDLARAWDKTKRLTFEEDGFVKVKKS